MWAVRQAVDNAGPITLRFKPKQDRVFRNQAREPPPRLLQVALTDHGNRKASPVPPTALNPVEPFIDLGQAGRWPVKARSGDHGNKRRNYRLIPLPMRSRHEVLVL